MARRTASVSRPAGRFGTPAQDCLGTRSRVAALATELAAPSGAATGPRASRSTSQPAVTTTANFGCLDQAGRARGAVADLRNASTLRRSTNSPIIFPRQPSPNASGAGRQNLSQPRPEPDPP